VIDIIRELREYGCEVDVYDPWADPDEVRDEYGIELAGGASDLDSSGYDGICLAVAHEKFRGIDVRGLLNGEDGQGVRETQGAVFDVKSFLAPGIADERL
jgi:UDP-N-acetyl-D-galactosamine dehydrogenase